MSDTTEKANWARCLRIAGSIPKDKLIGDLIRHIHKMNEKRRNRSSTRSEVSQATNHGSGVSAAILTLYTPELGDGA